MCSVLKRYTPKAIIVGLGLISVFALAQPTYAATYVRFGVHVGGPGWWGPGWGPHRWHHWHRDNNWCYWHPHRCGWGPRFCHRAWHPGYRDFWGYWHPGYWMRWCN